MLKRFCFQLLLVGFAIFFTLSGTWLKQIDVYKTSKSDLASIKCGWPVIFMEQNLSRYDPPASYKVRCSFFSLENPTKYYWQYFVINIIFFYFLILLLFMVSRNFGRFKRKA